MGGAQGKETRRWVCLKEVEQIGLERYAGPNVLVGALNQQGLFTRFLGS